MLDNWNEMSYNQFLLFDSNFKRDAYEAWHEYLDNDIICINEEYDIGENECWD